LYTKRLSEIADAIRYLEDGHARGRVGCRPRKLDRKKTEPAYQFYDENKYAVKEICQMLGVSKPTLYSYLARRENVSKD
jgi:hypothetical protein